VREFRQRNGINLWVSAIKKEMTNVKIALENLEPNEATQVGYKKSL